MLRFHPSSWVLFADQLFIREHVQVVVVLMENLIILDLREHVQVAARVEVAN